MLLILLLAVPIPLWAQPPLTAGWSEAMSTTLHTVCPANDFGGETYAFYDRCPNIVDWSGGTYDSLRNRLLIIGGGHTSYYGNEVYAVNFNDLTIERLNDPAIPTNYHGGVNTCVSALMNGTPNTRHTYDGLAYIPRLDLFWVFGGSLGCEMGGGDNDLWTMSLSDLTWHAMTPTGDVPDPDVYNSAYDPSTGDIFVHDSYYLYRYVYASGAGVFTRLSAFAAGDYHQTAVIDPIRKKYVYIGRGYAWWYDISPTSDWVRHDLVTTGGDTLIATDYPGLAYDSSIDRIVGWNGDNDVYILNLDTNTWTVDSPTGGPGALASNGTLKRWVYSPLNDAFLVMNGMNQNVWTYRIESPSFATKCALTGVLGCYGFDSSANVRDFPTIPGAYPLYYGGWGGVGPCASAGLGTDHPITRDRLDGELTAHTEVQDGVCYYPVVDTSVHSSGTGSLKIQVPALSNSSNGGYFDTTFAGLDNTPLRIGPDNGAEIYYQYKYRTNNFAQNDFNGAFPNSESKMIIFGNQPPGLDFFGSDVTMSSVLLLWAGYGTNRDGLANSYTYDHNAILYPTNRTVDGTLYLQPGAWCAYNGDGPYVYPPCTRFLDDSWSEVTQRIKVRPIAADFVVSGTTLSRTGTFVMANVGRYLYIVGDGYYHITAYIDADSVTLNASPAAGSGKSVYMSSYPNSIFEEWINGILTTYVEDQIQAWDLDSPGWGEFRLIPHQTGRDNMVTATPGTVWYDDYIVSTSFIPMGAGDGAPPPPVPMSGSGGPFRLRAKH